jgi:hypothetical protein
LTVTNSTSSVAADLVEAISCFPVAAAALPGPSGTALVACAEMVSSSDGRSLKAASCETEVRSTIWKLVFSSVRCKPTKWTRSKADYRPRNKCFLDGARLTSSAFPSCRRATASNLSVFGKRTSRRAPFENSSKSFVRGICWTLEECGRVRVEVHVCSCTWLMIGMTEVEAQTELHWFVQTLYQHLKRIPFLPQRYSILYKLKMFVKIHYYH